MNLKQRIIELERKTGDDKPFTPPLIYFSGKQTFSEAKVEYLQRHGVPFPEGSPDATVINFVTCDYSKEGGGREVEYPLG